MGKGANANDWNHGVILGFVRFGSTYALHTDSDPAQPR
jgi:hypothetical protein